MSGCQLDATGRGKEVLLDRLARNDRLSRGGSLVVSLRQLGVLGQTSFDALEAGDAVKLLHTSGNARRAKAATDSIAAAVDDWQVAL